MTKFIISGFTHPGTFRSSNEDAILINVNILNNGDIHLLNEDRAICFVADGVGGSNAGEFSSNFVLKKISEDAGKLNKGDPGILYQINKDLIGATTSNAFLKGSATTLSGIVAENTNIYLFHAGDSAIWLVRNDLFFKITEDDVVNPLQENSPITSYFGSDHDHLLIQYDFPNLEMLHKDIFLICSDGLFKSVKQKKVFEILRADKTITEKIVEVYEACLSEGMPDNVSVILLQPEITQQPHER